MNYKLAIVKGQVNYYIYANLTNSKKMLPYKRDRSRAPCASAHNPVGPSRKERHRHGNLLLPNIELGLVLRNGFHPQLLAPNSPPLVPRSRVFSFARRLTGGMNAFYLLTIRSSLSDFPLCLHT
jgi:hypothetical protein